MSSVGSDREGGMRQQQQDHDLHSISWRGAPIQRDLGVEDWEVRRSGVRRGAIEKNVQTETRAGTTVAEWREQVCHSVWWCP